MPELIQQLAKRVVLEAERLGHLLPWPAVHDNRPQRFILPVIDMSGLREEPLNSRIVHDLASMKMSVEDSGFLPKSFYPQSQRPADISAGKRPGKAEIGIVHESAPPCEIDCEA
jgi:hypothetical protein